MKVFRRYIEFRPFELNIQIDTEEEAATLYNIFNHSGIVDSCEVDIRRIRDELDEFSDNLSFYEFSLKLSKWFKGIL